MAGFTPVFRLVLLGLGLVLAAPATAQVETREGIALQNQILDLRRELDALRRGGGAVAAPSAPSRAPAASGDLVPQLLSRVQELEEENRRLRGRADVAENNDRQLRAEIEKLRGDLDFRLQALERGAGRPAAPRPPQPGPAAQAQPPAPASPAPSSAPRTPERAIADGQAALARRDFPTAEAAAREAIRARPGGRAQDAHLLLGDALMGKRDFQNAALAYDEAYSRNRQGARAPEAMIGLANAFQGFGAKREACETLDNLRSNFPNLSGPQAQRAADSRRRAQCR